MAYIPTEEEAPLKKSKEVVVVKQRSIREISETNKQEKLNAPIESSNIGFKLLQKLGFKANSSSTDGQQGPLTGLGLGKEGKGIAEPLPIFERSATRTAGLGVDEIQKQRKIQGAQLAVHRQRLSLEEKNQQKSEFVRYKATSHTLARVKKDVYNSKLSIYDLDMKHEVTANELWLESCRTSASSSSTVEETDEVDREVNREEGEGGREEGEGKEEEEDDTDPNEMLSLCLSYLREKYNFCYYCGHKYTDTTDMLNNCPGSDYDDH